VPLPSGTLVAPEANRVIVSLHPGNLDHSIDDHYVEAVANPETHIRWTLASGFSQVTGAAMAQARVSETLAAIARWRQKPIPPRVHLELGAMPDPDTFAVVRDHLVPAVDSLGLNEDELTATLALAGLPPPDELATTVAALDRLQRHLAIPRLGLHTRHCCVTITRDDPFTEQAALLYASAVAGSFARRADFPSPADLRQTVERCVVSPTGLALAASLADQGADVIAPGIGRLGDRWLVIAPTLAISHPASTIGLGDSFTGGLLAML
jgi:ADP-dependent phosphofructokinase/glucokinase